jgi:hypothetical protein
MAKETAKKKTPAKAAKATATKKQVAKAKATAAKKPVAKAAAKPVSKKEMNDYSGPYNPDLTFNDFSKEFLLKLMQVWQYAWLHMTEAWYDAVKEKVDKETADVCETAAWCRIGERVNPRFAKVANIELNTVLDSMKAIQLPLDNTTAGLFPIQLEVINPNHVIWTIPQCQSLRFFEAKCPERIKYVCYENEKRVIERYMINRKIRVTPLKLPPRNSPDEIACKWEAKMMDTDQWSDYKMPK